MMMTAQAFVLVFCIVCGSVTAPASCRSSKRQMSSVDLQMVFLCVKGTVDDIFLLNLIFHILLSVTVAPLKRHSLDLLQDQVSSSQ